jgi:hypothetical protein
MDDDDDDRLEDDDDDDDDDRSRSVLEKERSRCDEVSSSYNVDRSVLCHDSITDSNSNNVNKAMELRLALVGSTLRSLCIVQEAAVEKAPNNDFD